MPRGVKKITEILSGELPESAIEETEFVVNNGVHTEQHIPILDPRELFRTSIKRIRCSLYQLDESQRKIAENVISKAGYILDNQDHKIKEYLNELIRAADLIDTYVMYNFDKKLETTIDKLELKLNIPKKPEENTPIL